MFPIAASALPFLPAFLLVLAFVVFGGLRMGESSPSAPSTPDLTPPESAPTSPGCDGFLGYGPETPEQKAKRRAHDRERAQEFYEDLLPTIEKVREGLRPLPANAEDRAFDVFGEIVALMPESQRTPHGLKQAAIQARAAVAAFDATAPKDAPAT